jgi:DNA gyrase subunit B
LVTSHDWHEPVDGRHIASIRADASRHVVGGVRHLVLEVLAYALDEAAEGTTRSVVVTVHADGSLSVADDGRGTDTRRDDDGTWVVKPVMATADLRFFGVADAPALPDGRPRSGLSVVAALSAWLVHTNVRADGGWTARYVRGVPDGLPAALAGERPTGTTVQFLPDPALFGAEALDVDDLHSLLASITSPATVTVIDERR